MINWYKTYRLRKTDHDRLFNICVNYYNTNLNSEINGFSIENSEFYNGNQYYSLQLVIKDWSDKGSLNLYFDYKINDYSEEQIDDMFNSFINLSQQIINNPSGSVGKLNLLSDAERNKLVYEFNYTEALYPRSKTIYQLFEYQAKKNPNKVAIRFHNNELTYRELNEKANQIARLILNSGGGKEIVVGLLTTHSIETVIGIFAIIKSGGAYLPIDPTYPDDRINYMLEDSNTKILLTNNSRECLGFKGYIVDLTNTSLFEGDTEDLNLSNHPDELVYIIYTSGSTGKPKGTMIEHQGLVNYIWWAKQMYIKDESEVFPLYSSLSADLTVTSIFTPLICGGSIIIYPDNEEEYVIYQIMRENKVTVLKLTPAHLSLLKDLKNNNSSVKRLIVGGEDLKSSLAKKIYESFEGKIEIFNEYGPTETVVGCMIHKYNYTTDKSTSVPIGVPAYNVQIYILDENLNPLPKNVVGEIYISGDGVARGYMSNPKLTKEKFIENPFIKGKIMYATGDLARFLSDGKIEYIGRAGQQVKIRGYRIELGEIENYLINHEAVKDVIVLERHLQNDTSFICAYFVKKSEVSSNDLKSYLLKFLPDYMIPYYLIEVNEIPLTTNGKIDRELLPKPDMVVLESKQSVSHKTEMELRLIGAISGVLNIENISIDHNFYHIGGDSIKAIQIASKAYEYGLKIKVKDILSNPIIKEMSKYVQNVEVRRSSYKPVVGTIKLTPIVYWFLSQNMKNPHYYNQSILLELKKDISVKNFKIIIKELIKQHDSLRINVNLQLGEMFYNNEHLNKEIEIVEFDLSNHSYSIQRELIKEIGSKLKGSFNIQQDLLFKACMFHLSTGNKVLLLTAHHLVVDGVSWRIILDDIYSMIKQLSSNKEIKLPEKTDSYQTWAEMLGKYEYDQENAYWNSLSKPKCNFWLNHQLDEDIVGKSGISSAQLNELETKELLTNANVAYHTEPKDLLLSALQLTLNQFTQNNEVLVELESHGREDDVEGLDLNRTVGWFTSLYPILLKYKGNDLESCIKTIKEEIRMIPNKGIDFGVNKYLNKKSEKSYGDLNSSIRFNYLGDYNFSMYKDIFSISYEFETGLESDKRNSLTIMIDINVLVINNKVNLQIIYSNKFESKTIEAFLGNYINNIKRIINHCISKELIEFTPSDFETIEISQNEIDSLFK
ncbi:non-ribosomal peptide synthetase [Paenibacillus gorillae]|uniref:non-ribosomal peptide synthetase n=1 Tax=Paenibacillus gorillae TaxID=1243662 RepID=UPI0004AD5D00|nr:non-ribosomal peptide synthetase [Paenibacillus gorillae]